MNKGDKVLAPTIREAQRILLSIFNSVKDLNFTMEVRYEHHKTRPFKTKPFGRYVVVHLCVNFLRF